jgi:hypothetical protein
VLDAHQTKVAKKKRKSFVIEFNTFALPLFERLGGSPIIKPTDCLLVLLAPRITFLFYYDFLLVI